jgi:hypothetical protein
MAGRWNNRYAEERNRERWERAEKEWREAQEEMDDEFYNQRNQQQNQENKLIQMHKYRPNLNMTMAEELQRRYGSPEQLKICK